MTDQTPAPPPPPPADGVSWRPWQPGDVAALLALYQAAEEASGQPWRTTAADIEHDMAAPGGRVAQDTLVAVDAAGVAHASVRVETTIGEGVKHRAFLLTQVLPGSEQLEHAAIEWGEARAQRRFGERELDLPRVVRAFAEAEDRGRIERFQAHGYAIVRYFVDMVRDLADPLPVVQWPDGVELVPWSSRWIDPSWTAHCEAFADHWGSLPPSLDEWRHSCERPGFRPDLTVLAVVGDQVVGYTRNGVYPQDWEVRGRRDGWIDTLGTRPAWRRRGLASGLIAESMHRFRDAGLSHAALGVDAENPTGALGLYTRLGFVETNRAVALAKHVPNPGLGAQ